MSNMCPYCREQVDPMAVKCPHCRSDIPSIGGLMSNIAGWAVVIFIGLAVLANCTGR